MLVADDDEDILMLVSSRFEQAGHEVAKATDGDAALRLAKELAPDLAVIDVKMPGKTGYEVVEAMRAEPKTSRIPVILLTACVQPADVERGFEVGANDYIKKPFSPDELRSRAEAVVVLTLVSSRLEHAGYEVAQATDANAALRLAKELAPDLAVIEADDSMEEPLSPEELRTRVQEVISRR